MQKKQKPGDAVGRLSGRSSLLSDPGAKFFCENQGRGTQQEKTGAGLSFAALVGAVVAGWVTGQERSRGLSRTHRARRRKSSTCQSATQIAFRIAVVAGKMWTSQTENRFHLGCRYVHGQEFSSQPQIDDAPVGLRKALPNMPTFRPALINVGGSVGSNRGRWIAYVRETVGSNAHGRSRLLCYQLRGRMQQLGCGTGNARMSFHNLYPRSVTTGRASLELLIGKARQSSQMTSVGAGQVTSVGVRQLLTDGGRHGRFQWCGADANPNLQMARAALKHHTRLMAIGSHEWKDVGSRVIEVNENVAGIALIGIGQKIYVITLLVTGAQKAHHRSTHQLTGIPQSFSWARLSCGAVNQADEVERIRHGRELAADSVPGKKESAIEHGDENAIETPRNYNVYSADGNSPLNSVSQSRGAPHCHSIRRDIEPPSPASSMSRPCTLGVAMVSPKGSTRAWSRKGTNASAGKGAHACANGCG